MHCNEVQIAKVSLIWEIFYFVCLFAHLPAHAPRIYIALGCWGSPSMKGTVLFGTSPILPKLREMHVQLLPHVRAGGLLTRLYYRDAMGRVHGRRTSLSASENYPARFGETVGLLIKNNMLGEGWIWS